MKYIIDIEDEPFVRKSCLHGEEAHYRAKGFKSLVFDSIGLEKLVPVVPLDKESSVTYNDGLNDAWEAAKLIVLDWGLSKEELLDVFGCWLIHDIFREYTVQEVIEKLNPYLERQKIPELADEIGIKKLHSIVSGMCNDRKNL